MKKNTRVVCLVVLAFVSAVAGCGGSPRPDAYTIINTSITQPVDHTLPAGPTFTQQVDILIPAKAAKNAPVFFNLGNEHDLTDRDIIAP